MCGELINLEVTFTLGSERTHWSESTVRSARLQFFSLLFCSRVHCVAVNPLSTTSTGYLRINPLVSTIPPLFSGRICFPLSHQTHLISLSAYFGESRNATRRS